MKVLIVDDSKAMRCIIARALRSIGLTNTTYLEAADGKEGMKAVQDHHPELVISDFNMPGMSGMDLLRAIRAAGVPTRFGFVTSEASSQLHQEAEEAGALFVITKPFTAANLHQTLRPILADLGYRNLSAGDESPVGPTQGNSNFPKALQVANILRELLRRTVTVSPAPAISLLQDGHVVVDYRRVDDGAVIAYGILDVPCAVRVGAALSLIPPAVVAEAIAARRVTDTVAENLHEVLNVMSRLFDSGGNSRVCLGQVHQPGEPPSTDFAARVAKPGARTDTCVEIAGYGKGSLTLLSAQ